MFARRTFAARYWYALAGLAMCSLAVSPARQALSGNNNNNNGGFAFGNQVGGVMVNAEGVLSQTDLKHAAEVRDARQKALQAVPGDINAPTKLRVVSLRKLEEAIAACTKAFQPLPDEIRYLAGLQRVQYVFAYPEQKDVVIAGPAEGWKVNEYGNVVGITSGKPVMHLDDLLVALRSANAARNGGLSCSIDPTPEGLQNVQAFLKKQTTIGSNPLATIAAIEKSLGPQRITVRGVPDYSRFAGAMVIADYRMKRLAMNFEEAPVPGMPSYLDMLSGGNQNMFPRWWLAPSYEPLATDGEGLGWELRGASVKAMAEEDFFTAAGTRERTTKANPLAQKWADSMTANYAALAAKDTVFGDLQNCLDLAIVGALVQKENLLEKADCHLSLLLNEKELMIDRYNAPKQVESKASFIKKGKNWVISASGGVQVQPWEWVQKQEKSAEVAPARATALAARKDAWWWN